MLKCQNSLIKIEELLQIRKEAYANCDFSFNTDEFSILEVVSGLINKLNRFGFVI